MNRANRFMGTGKRVGCGGRNPSEKELTYRMPRRKGRIVSSSGRQPGVFQRLEKSFRWLEHFPGAVIRRGEEVGGLRG